MSAPSNQENTASVEGCNVTRFTLKERFMHFDSFPTRRGFALSISSPGLKKSTLPRPEACMATRPRDKE